jgi:hypothetical protein
MRQAGDAASPGRSGGRDDRAHGRHRRTPRGGRTRAARAVRQPRDRRAARSAGWRHGRRRRATVLEAGDRGPVCHACAARALGRHMRCPPEAGAPLLRVTRGLRCLDLAGDGPRVPRVPRAGDSGRAARLGDSGRAAWPGGNGRVRRTHAANRPARRCLAGLRDRRVRHAGDGRVTGRADQARRSMRTLDARPGRPGMRGTKVGPAGVAGRGQVRHGRGPYDAWLSRRVRQVTGPRRPAWSGRRRRVHSGIGMRDAHLIEGRAALRRVRGVLAVQLSLARRGAWRN